MCVSHMTKILHIRVLDAVTDEKEHKRGYNGGNKGTENNKERHATVEVNVEIAKQC